MTSSTCAKGVKGHNPFRVFWRVCAGDSNTLFYRSLRASIPALSVSHTGFRLAFVVLYVISTSVHQHGTSLSSVSLR
jgi:hypothetical protein